MAESMWDGKWMDAIIIVGLAVVFMALKPIGYLTSDKRIEAGAEIAIGLGLIFFGHKWTVPAGIGVLVSGTTKGLQAFGIAA